MSVLPSRELTKAIFPPPGDQAGENSPTELLVRVSIPWPLGFMVQISALHTKAILPFLPGKAAPAGSTITTIVSINIPTATSTPAAAAAASPPQRMVGLSHLLPPPFPLGRDRSRHVSSEYHRSSG